MEQVPRQRKGEKWKAIFAAGREEGLFLEQNKKENIRSRYRVIQKSFEKYKGRHYDCELPGVFETALHTNRPPVENEHGPV